MRDEVGHTVARKERVNCLDMGPEEGRSVYFPMFHCRGTIGHDDSHVLNAQVTKQCTEPRL